MPPPQNGNPILGWIILGGLASLFVIYYYNIATRKTKWLGFKLKRAALALALYGASVLVLPSHGYSPIEILAFSVLLGLTPLAFMRPPKVTRRIPRRIREAVIARDLKGQPFNPRLHHIDHIVPLSKGGDNSVRNLRVISKRKNLKKGAQDPGIFDFWSR